jgi:plasmid stabilization system protein ParE
MKLRFTPRGTQDLADIADYIRARSPGGALRVRSAILSSLQNLMVWPAIGRRQTAEGVRKLVTRRYPYFVYYTVDEAAEEIVILTIQHPARERSYENM